MAYRRLLPVDTQGKNTSFASHRNKLCCHPVKKNRMWFFTFLFFVVVPGVVDDARSRFGLAAKHLALPDGLRAAFHERVHLGRVI